MELLDKESYHIGHLPAQATSHVAGRVLSDIADSDDRIAVFTADLKYSNGTIEFEERHPDRFFNVGIAEQNMVSMAAGMAATGHITYVATFASFLGLLCCEQIRTCAAYTNLPVRLLGHHTGISFGYYGSSHHATEDIGIMRGIANLGVVCPCDAHSFEQALIQTVDVEGPIYFRLGRGRDPDVYTPDMPWEYGKLSVLRQGKDGLIIANGIMVIEAMKAAEILSNGGLELSVVDLHTIDPLDVDNLVSQLESVDKVFVAEEHSTRGGVATTVADTMVDQNIANVELIRIGFPADEYSEIAAPFYLYQHYGLDADGLISRIKSEYKK